METEHRIIKNIGETMYIHHPEASYSIFFYDNEGNLFIEGDWGNYSYRWSSYRGTFKEFLTSCNSDYIVNKLATNWNNYAKQRFGGIREKNIKILVEIFLTELKNEK